LDSNPGSLKQSQQRAFGSLLFPAVAFAGAFRCSFLIRICRQVEEMLADVKMDGDGNFKYKDFVAMFRKDA
jgi:hypothetical protein